MVTIIDVIRYEIYKKSNKIAEIKKLSSQLLDGKYVHISPTSASWNEYLWLKRDTSILLTALRLLKYGAAGDCHARKGKPAKIMSRHAKKLLRKFGNRLEKKPHMFAEAEQWAIQRSAALEARVKQQPPKEQAGEAEANTVGRMRSWLGI